MRATRDGLAAKKRAQALQQNVRSDTGRKTYEVRATRVEPVGLVYLVPLSA